MAILPDKIIEDYEFEAFIKRVNEGAEKIISDPKFKLTSPDLPGLSFLIKLQIRVFEKSLASSFAPIFLGKQALSGGGLSAIKDAFEGIKTLFVNPLQFLLNEGVNSTLEEFPFPLRLELGGSESGPLDLSFSDITDLTGYRTFNYNPLFNNSNLPRAGEYTTPQSSIETIQSISISKTTNTNSDNPILSNIKSGDPIQISDGVAVGNYTVSSVQQQSSNNSVKLELNFISSSLLSDTSAQTSVPGFGLPSVGFDNYQLVLSNFVDPTGSLKIPISALGLSIPLLGSLSFVIGDFNQLKDTSPTKKFVDRLSQESGLEFQEVFSGILSGNFPRVDFSKIQEEAESGIDESSEQSKIALISVARLLQIGITNPLFLIVIILNYVKLLLLPIKVVINVLKGLGQMITGPVALIRTVIRGITNPLGLICDLISTAFLEVLKPLIEPTLVAGGVSWGEALVDPNNPSRGLKPLISDMVCGKFSRNLKNYIPSQSFFENLRNQLSDTAGNGSDGPQITYDLKTDGLIPKEGQVSVDSNRAEEIRSFKISPFSNTVENATGLLTSLSPGDEFTFTFLDQNGKYRVSTKKFITNTEFPYFQFNVQPIPGLLESESLKSDAQKLIDGLSPDNLKAQLSVNNPDLAFLFIVENYLTLSILPAWEAIKGIIAIFGSLAQQVPSLLPAVVRGLFGSGNNSQSQSEVLSSIETEDFDQTSTAIDASIDVMNILYGGGGEESYRNGLVFVSTFDSEVREALVEIVNNRSSFSSDDSGIEEIFYDLEDSFTESGKDPAVFREKLSVNPGRNTSNNSFLNLKNGPDKSDFFWSAYSLRDIGNTVKVLTSISERLSTVPYFSTGVINLKNLNITVYINNESGNDREILYEGSIYNALNKYRFTRFKLNANTNILDLRILINRQMDLLVNYLLPSLKKDN
jgi:hypothetical protein